MLQGVGTMSNPRRAHSDVEFEKGDTVILLIEKQSVPIGSVGTITTLDSDNDFERYTRNHMYWVKFGNKYVLLFNYKLMKVPAQ